MRRLLLSMAALVALGRRRLIGRDDSGTPRDSGRLFSTLSWRTFLVSAGLLGALGALAGGLAVVLGLVPIKASSGHWALTRWFLNFSMSRSVATYSARIDVPPLDDPRLLVRGAVHYEGGCRPCHGGPASEPPMIARGMTPQPPDLRTHISAWSPAELFYIVKHGVKFTGMPAWPARHRDDEVWAMVAFLQRFPGLGLTDYERLVWRRGQAGLAGLDGQGGDHVPAEIVETCARCHGIDGAGRPDGGLPRLAGQRREYLLNALLAFAAGERHSGIMGPIADALTVERMRSLAAYYADQRPSRSSADVAGDRERGERIARLGIPERDVPSCADCHGPSDRPRNPAYPRLAGQDSTYLSAQLMLFREGRRGGSPYARLMRAFAARLTSEQARDAAAYYASLSP